MKHWILLAMALIITGCAAKSPEDFRTDKALYEHAMRLYEDKSYTDAIPFFESLRNRFPQSPYATVSELKIADAHFEKEEFLEAEVNYQSFRSLHPTHEKIPYVVYRIGMCHFEQIPGGPDRDQSETEKAIQSFSEMLKLWPNSAHASEVKSLLEKSQRKLEERELYVANWYLGQDEYEAALGRLQDLVQQSRFPEIKSEALYKVGYAYTELKKPTEARPFLEQAAQMPKAGKYAKKAKRLLESMAQN